MYHWLKTPAALAFFSNISIFLFKYLFLLENVLILISVYAGKCRNSDNKKIDFFFFVLF